MTHPIIEDYRKRAKLLRQTNTTIRDQVLWDLATARGSKSTAPSNLSLASLDTHVFNALREQHPHTLKYGYYDPTKPLERQLKPNLKH